MLEVTPVTLERSLARFQLYLPLSRGLFWAPVFFLYFSQRFSLDEILRLEAIYYLVVVGLEVPSGYFSDRVGRRLTLLISALAIAVAHALFLFGTSYLAFVGGQIGLAVGYSFLSGTDTAFHYDTLFALGRESEFAAEQARLTQQGYLVVSAAALAGGLAGAADLRFSYLLGELHALGLAALLLLMVEPPRQSGGYTQLAFPRQLASCFGLLRQPLFAWLFAYVVLQISIEHVPYEFAQPYVAQVLGELPSDARRAPLATGALTAAIAFVASFAAARSLRLRDWLGTGGALLAVTALQTGLITLMGAVLHPLVVPLILLRSVQGAIGNVLVNASITPRVPQAQRATYLSLHSLSGRLGFAGLLAALAWLAGDRSVDDPSAIAELLRASALVGALGLLALALTRRAVSAAPGGAFRADSSAQ